MSETIQKVQEEAKASRMLAEAKVKEGLTELSIAIGRLKVDLEDVEGAYEHHVNCDSVEDVDVSAVALHIMTTLGDQYQFVMGKLSNVLKYANDAECLFRESKKAEETAKLFE